jgi:hypothetical protein
MTKEHFGNIQLFRFMNLNGNALAVIENANPGWTTGFITTRINNDINATTILGIAQSIVGRIDKNLIFYIVSCFSFIQERQNIRQEEEGYK